MKKKKYLILSIVLLVIEILIALFIKEGFIRYVLGDYLVVILLYCILRTISNLRKMTAAISVLLFSSFIEFLQFIDIMNLLGLKKSSASTVLIGSTFDWYDILAYVLAFVSIILFDRKHLMKANS